jgi:hypothetical protein
MYFLHRAHSVLLLIRQCRAAIHILFCHALQPVGWRGGNATLFRDLGIRHGRPTSANPFYAKLS